MRAYVIQHPTKKQKFLERHTWRWCGMQNVSLYGTRKDAEKDKTRFRIQDDMQVSHGVVCPVDITLVERNE